MATDPFDELMAESMKPLAQYALARRSAVVLSAVFAGMLTILTIAPASAATGGLSAAGMSAVLSGVIAAVAWMTTSALYALANGQDITPDPLHLPPHYNPYGL